MNKDECIVVPVDTVRGITTVFMCMECRGGIVTPYPAAETGYQYCPHCGKRIIEGMRNILNTLTEVK